MPMPPNRINWLAYADEAPTHTLSRWLIGHHSREALPLHVFYHISSRGRGRPGQLYYPAMGVSA